MRFSQCLRAPLVIRTFMPRFYRMCTTYSMVARSVRRRQLPEPLAEMLRERRGEAFGDGGVVRGEREGRRRPSTALRPPPPRPAGRARRACRASARTPSPAAPPRRAGLRRARRARARASPAPHIAFGADGPRGAHVAEARRLLHRKRVRHAAGPGQAAAPVARTGRAGDRLRPHDARAAVPHPRVVPAQRRAGMAVGLRRVGGRGAGPRRCGRVGALPHRRARHALRAPHRRALHSVVRGARRRRRPGGPVRTMVDGYDVGLSRRSFQAA